MSELVFYTIDKSGDVSVHECIKNSYRGSSLIWEIMVNEHAPSQKNKRALLMGGLDKDFWDIIHNSKAIPMHHRITLAHTYDYFAVKKQNLSDLSLAFKMFVEDFGNSDSGHLTRQVEIIEKLDNSDIMGVCWGQMGYHPDDWMVNRKVCINDDGDCFDDICRCTQSYNFYENTKHKWLFDVVSV